MILVFEHRVWEALKQSTSGSVLFKYVKLLQVKTAIAPMMMIISGMQHLCVDNFN